MNLLIKLIFFCLAELSAKKMPVLNANDRLVFTYPFNSENEISTCRNHHFFKAFYLRAIKLLQNNKRKITKFLIQAVTILCN